MVAAARCALLRAARCALGNFFLPSRARQNDCAPAADGGRPNISPNIHPSHLPSTAFTPPTHTHTGDDEARKIGAEVMAREAEAGLSDAAKRLLQRKLKRVNAGEHDVYI